MLSHPTKQSDVRDQGKLVATFPATPGQQQFWFLDQLSPGDASLNIAIRWELRGALHSENLERAFRYVIDRHEILRTRLVEQDGVPVQQVLDRVNFRLGIVDIRTMPASEHATRMDDIAQQDAILPFDLAKAGLLRATLVRFSASRSMLLITVHHAVFDGFSIGVLGHEIGTATAAFQAGRMPEMDALPLQFGDYALWQSDFLASGALDEAKAYWAAQLRDAPYFEIPADHARPPVFDHRIARVAREMPSDFDRRLKSAAQASGVSPFIYGAAVASACLKKFTGAGEILFGTPIAGRDEVELEHLIGPMINSQILRFRSDFSDKFADHLAQSKSLVMQALTHQIMPFSGLVKLVQPKRDPSRAPLVSVNFSLQNVFMHGRDFGGIEYISSPSQTPAAARDLDIRIIGRPDGWRITVEYASALFDAGTAAEILDLLIQSFTFAFDMPDAELAGFPDRHSQVAPRLPVFTQSADPLPHHANPASDVTARMTALWCDVLGTTAVPVDVSFFDFGGHSLLAVRLISKVRAAWGIEIGVAAIYDHPTIGGLASLVSETLSAMNLDVTDDDGPDWRIEPISISGEGQQIIAVNDIAIMLSAGDHMVCKRPSVCVRLFDGTRGIDQTRRSFEQIAAEYAKVVKKAQPDGPYVLFGVCVHGNIAVETARILQAQGDTVAGVILKDVWEPGYVARMKADRVTRLLERKHALFNRLRMVRKGTLSVTALLGSYRIVRSTGILQLAARIGLIDRVRGTDLAEEQERFVAYIADARNRYIPAPLNIPVLHVVTDITAQGPLFSPSIGWEHVITGGLTTAHLPEVYAGGAKAVGIKALAAEIERFLAKVGAA